MTKDEIIRVVAEQRQFFNSGATRDYSVRHEALCKLKDAIKNFEVEIHAALKADLAKPEFEAYFTETGFCQHELTETIRKLPEAAAMVDETQACQNSYTDLGPPRVECC